MKLQRHIVNQALGSCNNCVFYFYSVYHLEGVNISHFTTVMDPTSSSTLCVGSSRLVLNHQGALSRHATLTLTADARVMDIELCCHWLETFCSIVETPDTSGLL